MRARGDGPLPEGSDITRLQEEVEAVLRERLPHGARVVLAVSGGADSVGLAWLVREACPDMDMHVAHVRHGLRDDADDAACAAQCAAALDVPFHERAVSVQPDGKGPEAAARSARYGALSEVCSELGADALLIAHTADDQAETVLLNLARGGGLRGASGMATERTTAGGLRVIRPLLGARRKDLRTVAPAAGLRWVEDPTNNDGEQRRARARHEALPALARLTGEGGDPVASLNRFATHARRESRALEALASREYRRIGRRWGAALALPHANLMAMPEGLALRVMRVVISELGLPVLPARTIGAALALRPGQSLHGHGLQVTCGGGWLALATEDLQPLGTRPLVLPGVTELPELGLSLWADNERNPVDETHVASSPPGGRFPLHARLPVPADAKLTLRTRMPGDKVRLRRGTASLQDLFTDSGVPRLMRDLIPIVVDHRDEPVWIPGVAVARMPESLAHVRAWFASMGSS